MPWRASFVVSTKIKALYATCIPSENKDEKNKNHNVKMHHNKLKNILRCVDDRNYPRLLSKNQDIAHIDYYYFFFMLLYRKFLLDATKNEELHLSKKHNKND